MGNLNAANQTSDSNAQVISEKKENSKLRHLEAKRNLLTKLLKLEFLKKNTKDMNLGHRELFISSKLDLNEEESAKLSLTKSIDSFKLFRNARTSTNSENSAVGSSEEKEKESFCNSNMRQDKKDLRSSYYSSLISNNYFQKSKESNLAISNAFIFDWDDTIMCTSYITPYGVITEKSLRDIKIKADPILFKKLERQIFSLLDYTTSIGQTYIVTNAASGWVQYSTQLFFPSLLKLLENVIIISARTWFEADFPDDSKMWKKVCFEEIANLYSNKTLINLTAIGDSLIEMEASYNFAKKLHNCIIKTVKLKESPSPTQLSKQLSLLIKELPTIVGLQKSAAVSVQRDKKAVNNRTDFIPKLIAKDLRDSLPIFPKASKILKSKKKEVKLKK